MADYQITCIDKDPRQDRYHAIRSVGGYGFRFTQQQAVQMIDGRTASFFVQSGLLRANVITALSPYGHLYLKTDADGLLADNLLSLPQCQ